MQTDLLGFDKNTNVRNLMNPTDLCLTHLGTATVLLELDGLRIVTDPVLDPAGSSYRVGKTDLLTHTHLSGPALEPSRLPPIDLALVSHDHHKDNLDREGRRLLLRIPDTFTTLPGARRLSGRFGIAAQGLAPWQSVEVDTPGGGRLKITATPAQHGPRWMKPLVGEVIGFVIEPSHWHGRALWISGDTVWFSGLEDIRRRFDVAVALVHVGAARFGLTGPIRYTFDAAELLRVARLFASSLIVPIHFEGWSHFKEGRGEIESAVAGESGGLVAERLRWLELGQPRDLYVAEERG